MVRHGQGQVPLPLPHVHAVAGVSLGPSWTSAQEDGVDGRKKRRWGLACLVVALALACALLLLPKFPRPGLAFERRAASPGTGL